MKIILAGGTGFIGTSLIPRLLQERFEVVVLTRRPGAGPLLPSGVRIARWDGVTAGDWAAHVDGADAVINLTGESIAGGRWTASKKERIISSRLNAVRAIRDAIGKSPKRPGILLNASAAGYYGAVDDGDVTEDHPVGKGFLADLCARWEEEAEAVSALGLRVALFRIGVVLGRNGGALAKMALPFRFFAGGTIGSGTQWFPWVHCDDFVNIVLFALRSNALSGPVNVASPGAVTMRTFCDSLGDVLHRPSWTPVPAPLLRLVLGEMADTLLTGQRLVPAKLQKFGYEFRFPALSPALIDIFR